MYLQSLVLPGRFAISPSDLSRGKDGLCPALTFKAAERLSLFSLSPQWWGGKDLFHMQLQGTQRAYFISNSKDNARRRKHVLVRQETEDRLLDTGYLNVANL